MSAGSRALPVVLVHGTGQDAEIWSEVVPLVSAPVYAHEFPGHGGRFGAPFHDVDALADDLVAHLPPSAADGAVLVGHSLGAAACVRALRRHPARVAGLVIVCASASHRPDRRVLATIAAGDLDAFVIFARASVTGMLGADGASAAHVRSADRLERLVRRNGLTAVAADYDVVASVDLADAAEPAGVPVIVLAGDRDLLAPRRRVAALADLLGAELRVVDGASHQLPWEAPDDVAAAVEDARARVVRPT